MSDSIGSTPKAVVEIAPTKEWTAFSAPLDMGTGVKPLFLKFIGADAELKDFSF